METAARPCSHPVVKPLIEENAFVVRVTFHGGCADEELEEMLDGLDAILHASGDRVAFVFDVTRGVVPSARQRTMMGRWLQAHSALIPRRCVGAAYILPSAGLRGMLTAILWFAPHPVPYRITASKVEAQAWARALVAEQSPGTTHA
jgi:hypothetical protein